MSVYVLVTLSLLPLGGWGRKKSSLHVPEIEHPLIPVLSDHVSSCQMFSDLDAGGWGLRIKNKKG